MKNIFVFVMVAILLVSGVIAAQTSFTTASQEKNTSQIHNGICGNQGFNCECKEFYKNNTHYYSIAKWEYNDEKNNYILQEQNPLYHYYTITVNGNLKMANWTSNPDVYSVLVKVGNNRTEFRGGASGSVNSTKDISHITFCGYKHSGGTSACVGANCNGNGVPEYSTLALVAAVITVMLGLIFLMKK